MYLVQNWLAAGAAAAQQVSILEKVNSFMSQFWHAALCTAILLPRQAKRAVKANIPISHWHRDDKVGEAALTSLSSDNPNR